MSALKNILTVFFLVLGFISNIAYPMELCPEVPEIPVIEPEQHMMPILKAQLLVAIFIMIRVDSSAKADYWRPVPPLGGGNDASICKNCRQRSVELHSWGDLYFVRRLLEGLNFTCALQLSCITKNEDGQKTIDQTNQYVMKLAYETYCALTSFYAATHDDKKYYKFLDRLSVFYDQKEQFIGLDVSDQELLMMLEMNRSILFKIIDLKIFEHLNGRRYFLEHFISAHCQDIQQSQNLSLEKIFLILNCLKNDIKMGNFKQSYEYLIGTFINELSSTEESSDDSFEMIKVIELA